MVEILKSRSNTLAEIVIRFSENDGGFALNIYMPLVSVSFQVY
jgi:hypothetical protein